MFCTYIHIKQSDGLVFYVGKGRLSRPRTTCGRNQMWHNIVKKHGFKPEILMTFENEADAYEHEKFIISCFKDMGIKLANMTEGGEGGSSGGTRSEESRKKLSLSLTGRKLSEQTKAKISASKKGKPKSQKHRENISKGRKGIVFGEQTRKKLSEATRLYHQKRRMMENKND